MTVFILSMIFCSTELGSMLKVSGRKSANTCATPHMEMQLAEAKKVKVGTITSAPCPIPAARRTAWRAVVPYVMATPYFAPQNPANAFSQTHGLRHLMPSSRRE